MNILFIFSEILIIISLILIEVSKEKLDFLEALSTNTIVLLVYNTIMCLILSALKIKIELYILFFINLFFSSINFIIILKNRRIQKYKTFKSDYIYFMITFIIISLIFLKNFGFPFCIKSETGDGAIHFLTSKKFATEGFLMPEAEKDEIYGKIKGRKPMSYVNSGLGMMCLEDKENIINYYNVYVCFDLFIILLTWTSLYCILKKFMNTPKETFIAFLFSLICVLGYPLNCMLFGFEYQSIGLVMFISIINIMSYYRNKKISEDYITLLLILFNFGLFFSYYTYIICIDFAIIIYMTVINFIDNKKIISLDLISKLLIIIILPVIMGYIYHMNFDLYEKFVNFPIGIKICSLIGIILYIFLNLLISKMKNKSFKKIIGLLYIGIFLTIIGVVCYKFKDFFNDSHADFLLNNGLKNNGYVYMNFYSNILIILPLLVFLFINNYDNKKITENLFEWLIFFINLFLIVILTWGYKKGLISLYYVMKFYYTLWIIIAIQGFKSIIIIKEKIKLLAFILISLYLIAVIISIKTSKFYMEYIVYNNYEKVTSVGEIFKANIDMILKKNTELTRDEIDIILESKKLDYSKDIEYIADETEYSWIYTITGYANKSRVDFIQERGDRYFADKKNSIDYFINGADYIVYFKNDSDYYIVQNMDQSTYEIIYQNDAGGIIEIKKDY